MGLLLNWHLRRVVRFHFRNRRKRLRRRIVDNDVRLDDDVVRFSRLLGFGLLETIGQVATEGVGAEPACDAEDGGDEEVVEVRAQRPERDEDGRVDVPRLDLLVHLSVLFPLTNFKC